MRKARCASSSAALAAEVNGQPRTVKVENREASASVVRRPKADPANPCHVSAPMPGVVAGILQLKTTWGSVAERERERSVVAGDLLMTIEAMKMETALHAERDGTVTALHVAAGQSVEATEEEISNAEILVEKMDTVRWNDVLELEYAAS